MALVLFYYHEKIRVAYGHPPSCSCGGLGDPSGSHSYSLRLSLSPLIDLKHVKNDSIEILRS